MFQVTLFTEMTIIFCKLAIVTIILTTSFFASWYLYDGDFSLNGHIFIILYYPSLVTVLLCVGIISWYISDMFLG